MLFFLLLNTSDFDYMQPLCLSLYGDEPQVTFYSIFDHQRKFFQYIRIGEHFFRIIFCFLIPVSVVLLIMRAEKIHTDEISNRSTSSEFNYQDSSKDVIRGLYFKY